MKSQRETVTCDRDNRRAAHLLLSNERAPEHADALADHGDVELVFLLEPRDDILERRVAFEHEAIPQRPLRRPVLIFHGHNRFRETEEWQGEVHEPIFEVLEFVLAIDNLREKPWDSG